MFGFTKWGRGNAGSVGVLKGCLTVVFCVLFFPLAWSQEISADTSRYLVETTDGNLFYGQVISSNDETLVFRADHYGVITLHKDFVKNMKEIRPVQEVAGQYWPEDIQATRYFWAPNGYGLKKKEGYYQNIWVLWNQVAYGATDRFSIGGGIIPLFLFDGAPTPVWITPKVSLPLKKDKVNLGTGALLGSVLGEKNEFGILYGMMTFGSRDKNMSLGYGNGFIHDRSGGEYWDDNLQDWVVTTDPVTNHINMISCSFIARGGPKGYFLSENMFVFGGNNDGGDNDNFGLISIGGRRIIRNVGLDYGLFIPLAADLDAFIAIPWLGLTVPF
ncbi:MAG: hypothetical protein OEX02_04400 [Cyclobacteriaceae bacterium]|nr:hypothetical protein [Cyclobacteriaceae bacterium]